MIFELVRDLAEVLGALPTGHPGRPVLALLDEAMRRDAQFIQRHPTALFQCLWNSCWWYDGAEAAAHYDLSTHGRNGPLPWEQTREHRLAPLLENWRRRKECVTPAFPWLRALRPPPLPLGTGQKLVLQGCGDPVFSVCFSPDGRRLADASGSPFESSSHPPAWSDRAVRVWDASSGAELLRLRGETVGVRCVCFSADSQRLATASADQTVRVWDAAGGAELVRLQGHTDRVRRVCFSPDGRRLASSAADRTVRVWDSTEGVLLHTLEGHTGWVTDVCFSPDGRRLASASLDRTVRLWTVPDGRATPRWRRWLNWRPTARVRRPLRHPGEVYGVCFSPDGRRVASASQDRMVRLWDASNGVLLLQLSGHKDGVTKVCFSPDGRHLASASLDYTVRLWDASTGAEVHRFQGHTDWVGDVCFSPDGRHLATASHDGTVRVWDASNRAELLRLNGTDPVNVLCFSRDGRQLATVPDDETVRVWDTSNGQCTAVHRGQTATLLEGFHGPCGLAHPDLIFPGVPDTPAPGPWRAGTTELDLEISETATGVALAWFPVRPAKGFVSSPSGRTFAWPGFRYLYLVTLEGRSPADAAEPQTS